MMSRLSLAASMCFWILCGTAEILASTGSEQVFVRVSPRDARYLELSDGQPFIPIGLNMIAPPGRDEKQALATMEDWMMEFRGHHANYDKGLTRGTEAGRMRIWLDWREWWFRGWRTT
jgi:hypothetical protein